MNYVNDICPVLCNRCADCLPVEVLNEYGLCRECVREDADVKAAEDARTFQALSYEWFTERSPLALERKSCGYEDVDYRLADY